MTKIELPKNQTVLLRKASVVDASAMIDYLNIVADETDNLTFGSQDMPITLEGEIEYLKTLETSTSAAHFVVVDGDRILATANIASKPRPRLAHVATIGISVLKEYWHQGIGNHLMRTMIDWAKSTGVITKINLTVRSDNQSAIALYKKFGFSYIGTFHNEMRIKDRYVDIDAMELILHEDINHILSKIAALFNANKVRWWVGGSSLLKLSGINIEPHDIDLFVVPEDFDVALHLLMLHGDFLESGPKGIFRSSRFARGGFEACPVDLIAEMKIVNGNLVYDYRFDPQQATSILIDDQTVYLGNLHDWLQLYLVMGNGQKAMLIQEHQHRFSEK